MSGRVIWATHDLQLGETIAIFMCSNALLAHLLSRLLPFAGHLLLLHVRNANSCRDSRLAKHTHTHRHTPLMSKYLQLVTGQSLQLLDKQSTRSGHFMYRVRVAKQVTHTHTHADPHTHTHTHLRMWDKHAINKLHDYTKF